MGTPENDSVYSNLTEVTQTIKISSELTRSDNYLMWKRQMELALSAKRKLGYVTGSVTKPPATDATKLESWLACNSLVISSISQNVSDRIKQVIIYTETAHEIWELLKKRYTVTNGARKY